MPNSKEPTFNAISKSSSLITHSCVSPLINFWKQNQFKYLDTNVLQTFKYSNDINIIE